MRRFHDVFVSGQGQLILCESHCFFFTKLELGKQIVDVGFLKVKCRHLNLVLVIHIAIRHLTGGGVGPNEVIDRLHSLQIHGDSLQPIGQLPRYGMALESASLLEISKLAHLHAIQPNLPAQSPGTQCG